MISNIIIIGERFSEDFANPAYNELENNSFKDKHEYYLLYENNIADQISSIVSLKNEISSINERMNEEMEKQKQGIIDIMEKKILSVVEKM